MTEPTEENNIRFKLAKIQVEIKAPKNQHNSFGNYDYRSAEDIQKALKPYEEKYGVATIINDTIEEIGGRVYVKATVTLMDIETGDSISTTAYAREAETKKGMDDAQVTGATSSYARKYALNGLLLLDDTKDVDSDEYQAKKKEAEKKVAVATSKPAQQAQTQQTTASEQQKTAGQQTPAGPNRLALREYMNNNLTTEQKADVKKEFNLNPKSTEKDYEMALIYAKTMILTGGNDHG